MTNTIKIIDMLKLAENHPVYIALQNHFSEKEKTFFVEFEKESKELNAEINTLRSGLTANLAGISPEEQAKALGQKRMILERKYNIQQQKMHLIEQIVTSTTYGLIKNELKTIMSASETVIVIDINACPYFTESEDITNTVDDLLKESKNDIDSIIKDVELKLEQTMKTQ